MKLLHNSISSPSEYQNVAFPYFLKNGSFYNYALVYEQQTKLVAYCIIIESFFRRLPFIKTARIFQGPVCEEKEREVEFLKAIFDYYKKNRYTSLTLQLRHLVNSHSEFILNELFKLYKFNYGPIYENTTTLYIDLKQPFEKIHSDFSTDLKKNLKKGVNKQIKVQKANTKNEILEFVDLYNKMCGYRKINIYNKEQLLELCNFALSDNEGFLLKATIEDKIIGAAIFANQGKRTIYILGATDPDDKKTPSIHLVLFEAIKFAQHNGQEIFDMGGYTFFSEEAQSYGINQFKLNFSSDYTFYTKKINMIFNPFFKKVADIILKIR